MKSTFLLLHGAWHGGWCWGPVAGLLRGLGHRVFTPTQTGLGERAHLLSGKITLDTFADDVLGVMQAEELFDVVLVGHSFGGLAISAAADRMPARIRQLVFLDSVILQAGLTPFDAMAPETAAARRAGAAARGQGIGVPPPPPAAFGVPDGLLADWVARRLTPHPISTYASPLRLSHPLGNGLPCTYVSCTQPRYASLDPARAWARAQPGWGFRELATGHDAMVTAPEALATLLLDLAGAEHRS